MAAVEEILRLEPDVALIDSGLSDLAVCEVIRRVRQGGSRTKCALISGKRDRKTVLEARRMRLFAEEFQRGPTLRRTQPVDARRHLRISSN